MADTISRAYDPPVDGETVAPVPWNGEVNNLLNAHNDLVGDHNDLVDEVSANDTELANMTSAIAQETTQRMDADDLINETLGALIDTNEDGIAANLAAITALEGGEVGNASYFIVKDITSAVDGNAINLNSAYADYNVMNIHTLTDTCTVALYAPTEFATDPSGRKFYILNSDLVYPVRVNTGYWRGTSTSTTVILRPGEAILVIGVDTGDTSPPLNNKYRWMIVSKGVTDYDDVTKTATTGNVTLTSYDREIQYIELDANRDCNLPVIEAAMDGMEFKIIVGSSAAATLTIKPSGSDEMYKASSDITVAGFDVADGGMAKVIAIHNFMFAGATAQSAWIVPTY